MIKDERYKAIMDLLTPSGTVRVNEIMEKLNVSDMTVRRDLADLEKGVYSNEYMAELESILLMKNCHIRKSRL